MKGIERLQSMMLVKIRDLLIYPFVGASRGVAENGRSRPGTGHFWPVFNF
jgi:hypothetical protein